MSTLWAAGVGPCVAQTIYDAQVLTRMEFSPEQRVKVEHVIEQSDKIMTEIFEKYGIDPEAKPDFDKLAAARHELQDLEAMEKREMKAIMTRQQFKYYLGLIQTTAANVIRATRNKP
ncbi:MAG: hypothetical protein HKN05_14040 [Rhizobiales bacterium]|nr:hypothetical protein [Hyphomicrobiales bacterium]